MPISSKALSKAQNQHFFIKNPINTILWQISNTTITSKTERSIIFAGISGNS